MKIQQSLYLAVAAIFASSGVAAEQWEIANNVDVLVAKPFIGGPKSCTVLRGGILNTAPSGENMYGYYRKGQPIQGECGPDVQHVFIGREKLTSIAIRKW